MDNENKHGLDLPLGRKNETQHILSNSLELHEGSFSFLNLRA